MVQGYIFGQPSPAETARQIANNSTIEAEGFACIREPRHRLMRRALAVIDGAPVELRLCNISSMGALVECQASVAPGTELAIDIVGVGPVRGIVRWAQTNRFGLQFDGQFDLSRLAPKKEKPSSAPLLRPWYIDQKARNAG
jgi:hypothetical protein